MMLILRGRTPADLRLAKQRFYGSHLTNSHKWRDRANKGNGALGGFLLPLNSLRPLKHHEA